MLNVNEYINGIRHLEKQIEEYNLRMNYRKLELGFYKESDTVTCSGITYATISATTVGNSTPNENRIYEADAEYANLMYKRDILKKRLAFLKEHGFMPDEI